MIKTYTLIDDETVFDGYFNVHKYTLKHTLYNGGWSNEFSREVFHRGDCVAVLLYDPERDDVVIIEQFRAGTLAYADKKKSWLLEIVAGVIEPGEQPEQVAYREAMEESGCQILELIKINEFFTSPGATSERLTLFYGRIDSRQIGGIHGVVDENEDIKVSCVKFDEVYRLLKDGHIVSATPIIALQWLVINRDRLRNEQAVR